MTGLLGCSSIHFLCLCVNLGVICARAFEVGTPGTYRVVVYIWCKPPPYQRWEKIFDDSNMVIDWPLGPEVVDLNFVIDGNQLTLP